VDAPPLLMHGAMVWPAQRHQVVERGRPIVDPVNDVVPVNPQM